jgi:SAM-dependent methyltransferase
MPSVSESAFSSEKSSSSRMPGKILNLGCGVKTSPLCINIDWSLWIRISRNPLLKRVAEMALDDSRRSKLTKLADKPIMAHDLKKGIPFADNSVDGVYHSHLLEHIDRPIASVFLMEVKRVLKPGGVHRIAVPDLERLARNYLSDFSNGHPHLDWHQHDDKIEEMIDQMVRRESVGTRQFRPLRKKIETLFIGDARRRGETHQWMYDRINLPGLLRDLGFREVAVMDYRSSRIPRWEEIGLDFTDDRSGEYKTDSLYVECIK